MSTRAVAAALTGLMAAAALSGCAAALPQRTQVLCDPPVPAGASTAAQAYAEATHDALQHRVALSDKIASQDMMMSLDDMRTAAKIDQDFLVEVRAIRFPAEASASAEAFVAAVEADGAFLLRAAGEDGYYGVHAAERDRLDATRLDASRELRADLGLPPSGCALNLP